MLPVLAGYLALGSRSNSVQVNRAFMSQPVALVRVLMIISLIAGEIVEIRGRFKTLKVQCCCSEIVESFSSDQRGRTLTICVSGRFPSDAF